MTRRLGTLYDYTIGLLFYRDPLRSQAAPRWREEDLARLRGAAGISEEKVGALIAAGFQHRIYQYDEGDVPMVVKILIPHPLLRLPTPAEANENIGLVSRYFPPYSVEPAEAIALADGTFALKQRRLRALRPLRPSDMVNEAIRAQLRDVVERNRRLMKEKGRSLDYLGREGQRKSRAALLGLGQEPVISNLVIEPGEGGECLRIIDTDLENFRPGRRGLRDLQSFAAAWLVFQMNRLFIRRFFHIDIG